MRPPPRDPYQSYLGPGRYDPPFVPSGRCAWMWSNDPCGRWSTSSSWTGRRYQTSSRGDDFVNQVTTAVEAASHHPDIDIRGKGHPGPLSPPRVAWPTATSSSPPASRSPTTPPSPP